MKVTKIVTLAKLYDVESGGIITKTLIGRWTTQKVRRKTGVVCVAVDHVKAVLTIPDEIVEKYAIIEVVNAPVEVAELN